MKIIFNLQWAEYNINRFCKCGLCALYGKLWMVCGGVYPGKNGFCDLIWQVNIFNLLNLNFSLCMILLELIINMEMIIHKICIIQCLQIMISFSI